MEEEGTRIHVSTYGLDTDTVGIRTVVQRLVGVVFIHGELIKECWPARVAGTVAQARRPAVLPAHHRWFSITNVLRAVGRWVDLLSGLRTQVLSEVN